MQYFYVYIATNPKRNFLFVGMTTNLKKEMEGIYQQKRNRTSLPGKNNCYKLLFYEKIDSAHLATQRLIDIKNLPEAEKHQLIRQLNPMWKFINVDDF